MTRRLLSLLRAALSLLIGALAGVGLGAVLNRVWYGKPVKRVRYP